MSETKIPPIDLVGQYNSMKQEIDDAVKGVLDSGHFVLGPNVSAFEEEFASYCDTKFSVGVASGTEAIFLTLKALEVGPGDEVITCSNSFVSTALSVSHTGAKPVFVDVEEKNFNMDPTKLEEKITEKTKVIMPIHLFGQCSPMDEINEIAEKHSLPVVGDACQAHGALYKNKKAGSLGTVACFSFYPTKNLSCLGDGGAITTSNEELLEKIKLLHNYGQPERYKHIIPGYNSRLDEINAAVLRAKLKHLDSWNDKRREHAQNYNKLLAGASIETPVEEEYAKHVYHQYVIKSDNRDALKEALDKQGIPTIIHYPIAIHLQDAYKELGVGKGSLPVTEKLCEQALSLPVYPELKTKYVETIAKAITDFQ